MELPISTGEMLIGLAGLIYALVQYIWNKNDKKIDEINDLKRDVTYIKANYEVMNSDVRENRLQLTEAIKSVNKLSEINERIAGHLDKNNSFYDRMEKVMVKILEKDK